jgi:mono/diheme cytochrome c family protein
MAGSWVFGAKGCSTCHAINGLGGNVGPDLGRVGQLRSFYDLASGFWNHYPSMVAQMRAQGIEPPHMSPREIGDLIAFLTSINYFDDPGDEDKGKQFFTEKECVRCHQVGGVGGVVGPSLDYLGQMGSFIQVATAMWNHGPAMAEAMQTLKIRRPSFTASELTDLIAYLRQASPGPPQGPMYVLPGRAELGRKWFVEKGCLECHSIRGQGGGRAPDLAGRARPPSLSEFSSMIWNKAPAMLRMMRTQGTDVPQLEVSQMADIVAYLYSIRYFQRLGNPSSGRRLVQNRGCLGCHALDGQGVKDGGDLAKIRGLDSPTAVISAMWNHGRVMTTEAQGRVIWPSLLPEEMADIAAFFILSGASQ